MIDTTAVNSEMIDHARRVSILEVIGKDTTLTHCAQTTSYGEELSGACPFCGGKDRFKVQPTSNRWFCRGCTGQWDSPIGYVMRRENLDFLDAVRLLQHSSILLGKDGALAPSQRAVNIIRQPPDMVWQTERRATLAFQQRYLWSMWGEQALTYLYGRGLIDNTIRLAHLGFSPQDNCITMPLEANGQLWQVKQRFLSGVGAKYKLVKGSVQGAPYLADWLSDKNIVVIVEGEFDALLLWQECHDLCDVLTLGSASVKLAESFLPLFSDSRTNYLIATDGDEAGERSAQYWCDLLGRRAKRIMPAGKDVTMMWQLRMDLRAWVKELTL